MVTLSKTTARALPVELRADEEEQESKAEEQVPDETAGPDEVLQGEPEEQEKEPEAPEEPIQVSERARQAAIKRAEAESQTVGGKPGPAASDRQTSGLRRSTGAKLALTRGMDLNKLGKSQMVELIHELMEERRRQPGIAVQKMIRWNNGTDPNVAENGEVVSARDTGSISIYGFARRPITLYAGQWVQFAHYMPDILKFIKMNLEDINEYVSSRLGNESKRLEESEVDAALALFATPEKSEAASGQ